MKWYKKIILFFSISVSIPIILIGIIGNFIVTGIISGWEIMEMVLGWLDR